jgi:predicted AAA+ superfamily ATPase
MQVYKSIPNQLAKENKKFQYKLVASNAKARSHSNAITWLEEFGLICKCHNLNNLELPLDGNKDEDTFKIYVTDTGLFVAMLEEGTVDNIINGDLKVYKGAIFENIIADAFNKMDKDLYYYHKQSGLEIDFVTRYNNELTLIEVKSNNGNAKSLKEVLNNKDKYDISSNFKLADTNIGTTNGINTIPLYMAFLIK